MDLVLFATTAYLGACKFASINQGSWLLINGIVVFLAILIGAVVYAFTGFLPTVTRERLRGAVKVELVQAILSIFIIIILLGFAYTTCQIGQGLTSELTAGAGAYQDPIQFSQFYLSNLLFIQSAEIFTQIYSQSAAFLLYAHAMEVLLQSEEIVLLNGWVSVQLDNNITGVFFGYTGVLTGTYTAMLVASYGALFIYYLLLPVIEAVALTVLLPLTLIIRSWPFAGPRLREAANSFLAIAIAFYFILPLTITMNTYIMNWLYCSTNYVGAQFPAISNAQNCNPYVSYIAPASFPAPPANTLFSAQTPAMIVKPGGQEGQVPIGFYESMFNGVGGISGFLLGGLKDLFFIPDAIENYGYEIAQYMFQAIVLVALDIAITIGFAQGLAKGLNAIPQVLGGGSASGVFGPFWGNV